MNGISIVGMSCIYPGAADPQELWDNAISGRRAFRRIPDVRTSLADYHDPDPTTPDKFYADHAAVLDGYEFDRVSFKIAGSTFRSTDLTHWLALDVAHRALADAGFPEGEGLPRERTGVVVGNTLTGEFSRANLLRTRWPYVRRVITAELRQQGWDDEDIADCLQGMEHRYKQPFPDVDEDTLAGGLANTIAGRICNYFDLHGGGYTVDGACSSSLLSVTTAAKSLIDGELDVAVAGGVDLSIDPFEIVGFAKTGALARTEMRLYDEGSNGFWPGEGCGMVVLMREEDALSSGRTPLAKLAGWGVSSDGAGGMTRPELAGYQLALTRAYERAGFGIETVPVFEGHGTGTPVGDDLELSAISGARKKAGATDRAAISSVKAQIGHTKAAAGVAGLIKAVQAVRHGIVPPTIGCRDPHERFTQEDARIRPVALAEPWPEGAALRAGVTSMGFGGINTHVVVEGYPDGDRVVDWDTRPDVRALAGSRRDADLLVFAAESQADLTEVIREAITTLTRASFAELTDHAIAWSQQAAGPVRAATAVTSPADAVRRLKRLLDHLEGGSATPDQDTPVIDVPGGGYLGHTVADCPAKVGLLFPGQGTGSHLAGGALGRHLPDAQRYHQQATAAALGDPVATQNAQPLTVLGSLAGLAGLNHLGIAAVAATGHSLGELSALAWAGSLDEDSLIKLAAIRGAVMAEHSHPGTMATLSASADAVEALLPGTDEVTIAALNSPQHTVIAGTVEAVEEVLRAAESAAITGRRLPVSHAFHSALVEPAAAELAARLKDIAIGDVTSASSKAVISTVTGAELGGEADLSATEIVDLLCRQIVDPVRFAQAVTEVASRADLLIEVGPGHSMATLAGANDIACPIVNLDTDDSSLTSYLGTAAAAWVGGALPDLSVLTDDRFHRPPPPAEQIFLVNPAEQVATDNLPARDRLVAEAPSRAGRGQRDVDALDLLLEMAAERAELPVEAVSADSSMLEDLHLSSITVGQIVAEVAEAIGAESTSSLNLATGTVGELADGLRALQASPDEGGPQGSAAGQISDPLGAVQPFVATWAEQFTPQALPPGPRSSDQEPSDVAEWLFRGTSPADLACWTDALAGDDAGGVILLLPQQLDQATTRVAFDAVQEAAALEAGSRLVVVGGHDTSTALAKTLFLEHPELRVTVVDGDGSVQPDQVADEAAATEGFTHVRYLAGERHVPQWMSAPLEETALPRQAPEQPVLLATGGAKGITAECALVWAQDLNARVALIGRSPASNEEVAATVRRFTDAGLEVRYVQADLSSPDAVRFAADQSVAHFGPITHVLHGAGRNEPAALEELSWQDVEDTFAPKVGALEALLARLDQLDGADSLQRVATFGSVIGRAGLWGEAHYAMANAELARVTRAYGETHPGCATICLEWSVWSDVGMGARMGAVDSLASAGVTPIPPQDGIAVFRRAVNQAVPPELVVCGRTDSMPTVRTCHEELPLGRFLERIQRHHPGCELVTDAVLSLGSDPYLVDHEVDGDHILPAVIGLEAMAQVASALVAGNGPARICDVRLDRPVVVPASGEVTVRLGATRRIDGVVEVVLLSEESNYAVAHFSAAVDTAPLFEQDPVRLPSPPMQAPVDLDPDSSLYGEILFQSGRFQRVSGYDVLSSTQVRCRVDSHDVRWFSEVHPDVLVLGDPGVRDALMHGNQVSVPDATLLPQRIDLVEVLEPFPEGGRTFVAHEVRHEGALHVYDIDVLDDRGVLVERWRGLHLRAVRYRTPERWPVALVGPHLERVLEDAGVQASVRVTDTDPVGVTASVEGASCVARIGSSREELVAGLFSESRVGSEVVDAVRPVELGTSRGVQRLALGQAQGIAVDVVTGEGEQLSIALVWRLRSLGRVEEVVA